MAEGSHFIQKEKEILHLFSNDDETALSMLYDQYAGALLGIIRRRINDVHLAEEVLQDTFFKIWKNIASYDPAKGSLFSWMARIAQNTAIDKMRGAHQKRSLKTDYGGSVVDKDEPVEIHPLDGMQVDQLLARLDEKHRIILEYLYQRDFTQKELSDELQIPLGTVKTRARNALLELRGLLKNELKLWTFFPIIIQIGEWVVTWLKR